MKKIMKMALVTIMGLMGVFAVPVLASAKDSDGDIVVVVDPGHGASDGGASSKSGAHEANLNWEIAKALKAELQTYQGVKVYLTRGSAEWFTNAGRGRAGSGLGADLLVSCHNNSGGASQSGVTVYGTVNQQFRAKVSELCKKIADKVSSLGIRNNGYEAREDNDVPGSDYYTILDEAAKAGIPGIIIEHAFLSNSGDASFISNPENQKKTGAADATAIAEYFGLQKRGVQNGGKINLTRTYSAYMQASSKGTFESSDSNVAQVRADGLITACAAGTAQITSTDASGNKESVTIHVPEVKLAAIIAGINPTFYEDATKYDQSEIILKGINTDGSVKQIESGYKVGALPELKDRAYDIPITYSGLSTTLRIYNYYVEGAHYSSNLKHVSGENEDILVVPELFEGLTTGGTISTTSTGTGTGTKAAQNMTENTTDTDGEILTFPDTTALEDGDMQKEHKTDITKWLLGGTIIILGGGIITAALLTLKNKR